MLVVLGIIKRCNAELLDGNVVEVSKETWGSYWDRITMLYLKKKLRSKIVDRFLIEIVFRGRNLKFKVPEIPDKLKEFEKIILEQFYFEPYRFLRVKGCTVVDIGAWVGDTSILFAVKGASKVIAVEPHPYSFQLLLENISENGLQHVVKAVNAAVSSKPGKILVEKVIRDTLSENHYEYRVSKPEEQKPYVEVPVITLSDVIDLVKKLSPPSKRIVMKMDCEGCEYDALINADVDELKRFDEIILEYHGKPKPLIEALTKAKFHVRLVA
jgi:FkbM family methyltransferase